MARTESASELVDDTVERYVDWREACRIVRTRYERWSCAPERQSAERFVDFHAALDREEWAAQLYAASIARLARALWPPASS